MKSIFGYFDSPDQTEPTYDPGLPIECPFCHGMVECDQAIKTISFVHQAKRLRTRSWFYRCHKFCYESAEPNAITELESSMIDGINTIGKPNVGEN